MEQYEVKADRETCEWINQPVCVGEVEESEWSAMQDTDDVHYDTFQSAFDGSTLAVAVIWVD